MCVSILRWSLTSQPSRPQPQLSRRSSPPVGALLPGTAVGRNRSAEVRGATGRRALPDLPRKRNRRRVPRVAERVASRRVRHPMRIGRRALVVHQARRRGVRHRGARLASGGTSPRLTLASSTSRTCPPVGRLRMATSARPLTYGGSPRMRSRPWTGSGGISYGPSKTIGDAALVPRSPHSTLRATSAACGACLRLTRRSLATRQSTDRESRGAGVAAPQCLFLVRENHLSRSTRWR